MSLTRGRIRLSVLNVGIRFMKPASSMTLLDSCTRYRVFGPKEVLFDVLFDVLLDALLDVGNPYGKPY